MVLVSGLTSTARGPPPTAAVAMTCGPVAAAADATGIVSAIAARATGSVSRLRRRKHATADFPENEIPIETSFCGAGYRVGEARVTRILPLRDHSCHTSPSASVAPG